MKPSLAEKMMAIPESFFAVFLFFIVFAVMAWGWFWDHIVPLFVGFIGGYILGMIVGGMTR